MKKIKRIVFVLIVLVVVIIVAGFFVRRPCYSIHTSGKLYIFNKLSQDVTVFDLQKGKAIAEIPIEIETHGATALPNQNRIAVANYGTAQTKGKSIIIINTEKNCVEKTIKFAGGYKGLDGIVALQNANKVAVISRVSNQFLIVNLEKGTVESKVDTQQNTSHFFVFHPCKPLVYVTNIVSGSVSVINLNTNIVCEIIPCGAGTNGIDITPDGSEVWVANANNNSISIISTLNNKVIKTLKTGNEPLSLKFSVDGRYCLVTNLTDGTISVFNQSSCAEIKTISIHGKKGFVERLLHHTPRPVTILMHPNGLYAFVSNSNANKVEVIDMKTFEIVSTIGTGKVPAAMVFIE